MNRVCVQVCVCVWWMSAAKGHFWAHLKASPQFYADVIIRFDYSLTSLVPVAPVRSSLKGKHNRVTWG